MKSVKKYLAAVLTLALAAPVFTGCTEDDSYSLKSVSASPSDKFNAKIQVVSRLNDAPLVTSDADYTAINNYMVNTLKGQKGAWLTILDRTDNVDLTKVMTVSLNAYRWTAFAFNRLKNKTTYEGSMLFFNQPSRLVKSEACGKGCYITGMSPKMEGTRTDKDEDGNVTGTVDVSFNIEFRTARFDTSDQISAFGGENGVMNTLKREKMNMLMIGTVRNELFSTLQSTVASTDATFHAHNLAQGSGYTLFMVCEERFWAPTGVTSDNLANGITAYTVNLMW